MLTLGRKLLEAVDMPIGNGEVISVTVLKLCNGGVRLGFEAPERIQILRRELWRRNKDGRDSVENTTDGNSAERNGLRD